MFQGDEPAVRMVLRRAVGSARRLGHPRVGVEHLLVGLAGGDDVVATVLARHGATCSVLEDTARAAAPLGAGAAADAESLALIGVDLDRLLQSGEPRSLDRLVGRQPLFPLGSGATRRRCASWDPPLGLDAQGVYEASLRLSLARDERCHRPEHLAMVLASLDPGAGWVLTQLGTDRRGLLQDLARTFPPPQRSSMLRVARSLLRSTRQRDLLRRYQRTTGRPPIGPADLASFVAA